VTLVNRAVTVLTVWMVVSVPVGILVGKVLKARLGEQELLDPLGYPAVTGEMGLTELERRVRRVRPDPVGLQGLAGNQL
jgi:hypothetical protein